MRLYKVVYNITVLKSVQQRVSLSIRVCLSGGRWWSCRLLGWLLQVVIVGQDLIGEN